MQTLIDFFGANGFLPHGYCLTWSSGLLWLHVVSDVLIVLAYYSIPLTLVYFVRKRKDLPYPWLFAPCVRLVVASKFNFEAWRQQWEHVIQKHLSSRRYSRYIPVASGQ